MFFYTKCPLSHHADKGCPFALEDETGIKCRYIFGWYHKLNIKHLTRCFFKMKNRDRLAWRNEMIKKFGQPEI